jgi:hypothetical protein
MSPAITGSVESDGPVRAVDQELFVGLVTSEIRAGHALALLFPSKSRLALAGLTYPLASFIRR